MVGGSWNRPAVRVPPWVGAPAGAAAGAVVGAGAAGALAGCVAAGAVVGDVAGAGVGWAQAVTIMDSNTSKEHARERFLRITSSYDMRLLINRFRDRRTTAHLLSPFGAAQEPRWNGNAYGRWP